MVDDLEKKLEPHDRRNRQQGFAEARQFIDRAAQAGGVSAPMSGSFPKMKKDDSSRRVDVEVITGQPLYWKTIMIKCH